ncbi:MAG: GNAT family N-acetyltransferase [Pseudomonadota bacterium]
MAEPTGPVMTVTLSQTPVLETERLMLRAIDPQDLEPAIAFLSSDRAGYVGGGANKDQGHCWRIVASLIGHWVLRGTGPFTLMEKSSGKPLGSVGPFYPQGRPERELSWTIWSPEAEGSGFAFEAVMAIREHVYHDLGWETAVSYIDPSNTRSIALARRLGGVLDPDAPREDANDLVFRHPKPGDV